MQSNAEQCRPSQQMRTCRRWAPGRAAAGWAAVAAWVGWAVAPSCRSTPQPAAASAAERGAADAQHKLTSVVEDIVAAWPSTAATTGPAEHSRAQGSTARHGTARHSTVRHSSAWHSTTQHSTAHLGWLEVPHNAQHRAVGPLPALQELPHVIHCDGLDLQHVWNKQSKINKY